MRVVVLAPSIYSDRAVAAIAALDHVGLRPTGCLTIRTASVGSVWRKMVEFGPRRFVQFAAARLFGRKLQKSREQSDGTGLTNPFVEQRLASYGVRERDAATLCARLGIPLHRCGDLHDPDALRFLREAAPDVLVYTGGGILRRPLLEIPRIGVVNTHAGILPYYRGMNVTEWAILRGDEPGVTVQLIDAGIDTGPILSIRPVPVEPDDTSIRRFRHRVADITVDELVSAVVGLSRGDVNALPQAQADGLQFFVMHEKLLHLAERRLLELARARAALPR